MGIKDNFFTDLMIFFSLKHIIKICLNIKQGLNIHLVQQSEKPYIPRQVVTELSPSHTFFKILIFLLILAFSVFKLKLSKRDVNNKVWSVFRLSKFHIYQLSSKPYYQIISINSIMSYTIVGITLALGWPHTFFMNEGQKISFGPPFEVFLENFN